MKTYFTNKETNRGPSLPEIASNVIITPKRRWNVLRCRYSNDVDIIASCALGKQCAPAEYLL